MAASKASSRYAAVEPFPVSDPKSSSKRFPFQKNPSSNSNSFLAAKNHPPTFGTMVKRIMGKQSDSKSGSGRRAPSDAAVEDLKKAVAKGTDGKGFSGLRHKLFHIAGSAADRTPRKALTEVSSNTRTLGMVLRSERELMAHNKEYERVIQELRLLVEERNLEVDKLKNLCLKQREEIKMLKDAVLFPDVVKPQLQELFEKQGSELKDARKIIPCLQRQVSSLTGKIQCLAEDLAEVKADKYAAKNCFDGLSSSPKTPKYDKEYPVVLEYNSGNPQSIDDINPCLTPCFSKVKSKGYRGLNYSSPITNRHFQDNEDLSQTVVSDSHSWSSEPYQTQSRGIKAFNSEESSKFHSEKQSP